MTFTELPRYILPSGKASNWVVRVSFDHPRYKGCYGYFEHDDGHEGGLWFTRVGAFWSLADYDGVFALPASVYYTLRADARFLVDDEFFC